MNNYARLSHVKGDVAGLGTAANLTLDPVYVRAIDATSREFERECGGRQFYSRVATRYYQGSSLGSLQITVSDDILSLSSLTVDLDGDGVYETTLVAETDYWLEPQGAADRGEPYWALVLNPLGTQLTSWPTAARSVKAVCSLGWPETFDSAGTLTEDLDASETGVDLTAGHSVELGDVIKVDAEQMYVSAASASTATVVRGINGTTAATHANLAAVTVRRYPADLEEAVRLRATQTRWDNNSGNPLSVVDKTIGGTTGVYPRWRSAIARYKKKGMR